LGSFSKYYKEDKNDRYSHNFFFKIKITGPYPPPPTQ
jgi:hypothetical protein